MVVAFAQKIISFDPACQWENEKKIYSESFFTGKYYNVALLFVDIYKRFETAKDIQAGHQKLHLI